LEAVKLAEGCLEAVKLGEGGLEAVLLGASRVALEAVKLGEGGLEAVLLGASRVASLRLEVTPVPAMLAMVVTEESRAIACRWSATLVQDVGCCWVLR